MNTVRSIFEQAQLAEAAYANLWDAGLSQPVTFEDDVKTALIAEKFSPTQAAEFVNNWRVVDHVPDLSSGFSIAGVGPS